MGTPVGMGREIWEKAASRAANMPISTMSRVDMRDLTVSLVLAAVVLI